MDVWSNVAKSVWKTKNNDNNVRIFLKIETEYKLGFKLKQEKIHFMINSLQTYRYNVVENIADKDIPL